MRSLRRRCLTIAMRCSLASFAFAALLTAGSADDNGRALKPPRGWRSWNCFYADINQTKIAAQIDALVLPRERADGTTTTLQQLGFNSVGIDEGYEGCGLGVNGTVHTADGTPTIDPARFPNMSALVAQAHAAARSHARVSNVRPDGRGGHPVQIGRRARW